jgi:hypothetical protein
MEVRPHISPMTWVSAREVLPHEAHDFTPWLADNLELLADVLGLDQLELVATEWKVETFALDILARGSDADGEVMVVIENQYGLTDHRHLGQILTYAAHAAASGHRVLAVWLTEEARPAHLAAVEFLNRVGAEGSSFGLLLMRVRFAPAPSGWHVHFEVDSAPNSFLSQPAPTQSPGRGPSADARARFIEAVAAELDPLLEGASLRRRGGINTKHGAVIYKLPAKLEVAKVATARVICTAATTNVALYLQRYHDAAANWAVAELLRRTYEPLLDRYALHVDTWHGSGPSVKRDRVITTLPAGYATGDPREVAAQAGALITAWTRMLTDHPITGLDGAVADLAAEPGARTWDPDVTEDLDPS